MNNSIEDKLQIVEEMLWKAFERLCEERDKANKLQARIVELQAKIDAYKKGDQAR